MLTPEELIERDPKFWSHVKIAAPDDCWQWTGPRDADGYGRTRGTGAHRVAYRLANDEIPAKTYILHTCDCPSCCNPDHLVAGTQSENMRQKFARGRHTDHARKLSERDVIRMRRLAAFGTGYAELAKKFGITHGHARNILNGNKWPGISDRRHVGEQLSLFDRAPENAPRAPRAQCLRDGRGHHKATDIVDCVKEIKLAEMAQ